jgi:acyl-ACP thioesterase
MQSYTYHLDMNKHVNNTHYVDWMLEILEPSERLKLRWFDLVFLNELGAQEALRIQRMENRLQLLNTESDVIALANWS